MMSKGHRLDPGRVGRPMLRLEKNCTCTPGGGSRTADDRCSRSERHRATARIASGSGAAADRSTTTPGIGVIRWCSSSRLSSGRSSITTPFSHDIASAISFRSCSNSSYCLGVGPQVATWMSSILAPVSNLERDRFDLVTLADQAGGAIHADARQILAHGHPHLLSKEAPEVGLLSTNNARQRANGKLFARPFLDQPDHVADVD